MTDTIEGTAEELSHDEPTQALVPVTPTLAVTR
jgi:hypothetical protein